MTQKSIAQTKIHIINLNHQPLLNAVYIGRPSHRFPNGSPLANPFAITDQDSRTNVIEKYTQWLERQLMPHRSLTPAAIEIERLTNLLDKQGTLTLACYCAPFPCHGDVVARILTGEK